MNKVTEKVTKAASHLYSDEKIAEKAANGTRKGESMQDIYAKIMSQCERDDDGNLKLNGKTVGWIKENGMGWIDDKAYDNAIKDTPLPTRIPEPHNDGHMPAGFDDIRYNDEGPEFDDSY
jgi:hypothetical protein